MCVCVCVCPKTEETNNSEGKLLIFGYYNIDIWELSLVTDFMCCTHEIETQQRVGTSVDSDKLKSR